MGKKKKVTVVAHRLHFNLPEVLPPTAPFSLSLVRLMMAVNDARHIQKLLAVAGGAKIVKGSLQQSVQSGETLHLFRLLAGHLYEAGIAFRGIKSDILDNAVAQDTEGKEKLSYLIESFSTDGRDALHYAYLKPIRDNMGFHYRLEPLKEALERHTKDKDLEGVLVISELLGLSRYCIGDHLAISELQTILGVTTKEYRKAFETRTGEVLKLADALSHVVDLLLVHVLETTQNSLVKKEVGALTVPPALVRIGRRRFREQKKQKGR